MAYERPGLASSLRDSKDSGQGGGSGGSPWQRQIGNLDRYNMDDLGYTDVPGMGEDGLNLQLRSERRVAARNQRIAEQASRANMEGLRNMQSYRAGGAASMMSNYYANASNLIMGQQTEAPDLLGGYREDQARQARNRADKQFIAGSIIGGSPLGSGAPQAQLIGDDVQPTPAKDSPGAPGKSSSPAVGGAGAPPGGGAAAAQVPGGGGALGAQVGMGGGGAPAGHTTGGGFGQGYQTGGGFGGAPAGAAGSAGGAGGAAGAAGSAGGAAGGVGAGAGAAGGAAGGAGAGAALGPIGAIAGAAMGGGGAASFSAAGQADALAMETGQSPAVAAAEVADQTWVKQSPYLDWDDDTIDMQLHQMRTLHQMDANLINGSGGDFDPHAVTPMPPSGKRVYAESAGRDATRMDNTSRMDQGPARQPPSGPGRKDTYPNGGTF